MTPKQDLDTVSLEREYTEYAFEQAHPLVRAWRGDQLKADIREATKSLVALIADDDAARRYAETMKVLARPQELFKMRSIEIDGRRFLAQIGFRDPSASLAFVSIFRASTLPGIISDASVLRRLAHEFAVFAPRRIRFYQPAHVPIDALATHIDQHFLAGLARDMAARPTAPGLARVILRRPADLGFYPRYVEAYEQMFLERPQMRGEVRIESEETLAACHSEGLLHEIEVDGVWAGIVAARHQVVAGVRGTYMVEILLDRVARGQRLGPAVHQLLAAKVAATDPSAVVTGTIARVNLPSLKVATRAGRVEIGAWHWIDV
jgi:hypothetical protein